VASLYLAPDPIEPPFLVLLASGGHTLLAEVDACGPGFRVIGQTLDDAAGEAFDKGARLLGLGYPGGAALERLARDGDDRAFAFPVAMAGRDGLDLSFSGLKTALRTAVLASGEDARADLAAGYQRAIVRSLVSRTMQALEVSGRDRLAAVGGVAANSVLRSAFQDACDDAGVALSLAPLQLCSDNAAMIASAARFCEPVAFPGYLDRDAYATA
jgi:N6-L-threonylcarbamoyladenine synthase